MKLVSYLTPSFWPGLKVLAHSLAENGNMAGLDWIVMTERPAPKEWGKWLGGLDFYMENMLFSEVGELPDELPRTADHLKFNWNKLRMLLLPEGRYLYLDVDLLCMNEARGIEDCPSISAAKERPGGGVPWRINAGLIRFDANHWLYDECAKVMEMSAKLNLGVGLAEQTILNTVFDKYHDTVKQSLGDEWNMPAFLATRDPPKWEPDKAIFIHYTGQTKPWDRIDGRLPGDRNPTPRPVKAEDIWRDYAASLQEVPA